MALLTWKNLWIIARQKKNDVLQLCLFTVDKNINDAVFKYKDKMTSKCLVPY